MLLKLPLLAFALGMTCFAQSANWSGPWERCRNSGEFKRSGYLRVGVRYNLSDRANFQPIRTDTEGPVDGTKHQDRGR